MGSILHREDVFAIVGAAIEVHRVLGPGFLEAVYQVALAVELQSRSIPFESQVCLPIYYKGQLLEKSYCADYLCYEQIIVEIKAIDKLTGMEEAQLHNYLRATGLQVGLLINFGAQGRLEWKRWVV
jgi:GxxExxY protein